MAKFCGKCGAKLDETTGFCPNCDAEKIKDSCVQEKPIETPEQKVVQASEQSLSKKDAKKKRKADKKAAKKARKKETRAQLTVGQKVGRFFLKMLLWIILLIAFGGGLIGGLSYIGVLDVPFLSAFEEENLLGLVNEKCMVAEETNIVMETSTEGTATIIVQMPNYEVLFEKAFASENPEQYMLKALILGNYEIQEFERTVKVTVENGETIIHSDEVLNQLLEEALVNAINALSEVE